MVTLEPSSNVKAVQKSLRVRSVDFISLGPVYDTASAVTGMSFKYIKKAERRFES
jgi:hypothetical protein